MTRYLFEDPTAIIVGTLLIEGILGIVFVQTRRMVWLGVMGGVLLLMIGLVLLERYVITPTEEVEQAVAQLQSDMENNDAEAIVGHLSPKATASRQYAQQALRLYEIERTKVTDLEVRFPEGKPATAEAEFTGVIHGRMKSQGDFGSTPYRQRFILYYEKSSSNDKWLITGYKILGDGPLGL